MYMYITVYTWSGDGTWAELILSAYFFSLPKPIILLSLHAAKPFRCTCTYMYYMYVHIL